MFGRRFFGAAFFGPRYWGDGGEGVPPTPPVLQISGGSKPKRKRERELLRVEVHVTGGGMVQVLVGEITEQIPRREKMMQMLTAMAV